VGYCVRCVDALLRSQMTDITKCQDNECPAKDTCYRYITEPHPLWQSWFAESPRHDHECEMYWHREAILKTAKEE